MASQTQFLEWHGQQWRVRVKVPAKLRRIMGGRGKLLHPLHTADLEQANQRKWRIVAAMKADIEQARRVLESSDPVEAEALRDRLAHPRYGDENPEPVMQRYEEIGETHGWGDASRYFMVATGRGTPLDFHEAGFLAHKTTYRTKSIGDFRRVLAWLKAWLGSIYHPAYVEDIDRKIAGQFIDEFLLVGRSRDKASAYLGFLREYWRWLRMRDHAKENPWVDQDLPVAPRPSRSAEPDAGKRPYTEDEMRALLYGPAKQYLPDLMRVAALSGMRIEEICQLRAEDCGEGHFMVWHGKTDNARRSIPIHRDLTHIVAARTKGKQPKDYLFDELPDLPKSRDTRSDPASKRFTRYRREVGVDERPNEKAKSNVDFHSLRRWFIKSARDRLDQGKAGYSPWTIADVVGHDDEGVKNILKLTMAHYPGPSSEKSKRALVDAIKLPTQEKR